MTTNINEELRALLNDGLISQAEAGTPNVPAVIEPLDRESLRLTIESSFAKAEFSMRAVQSAMLELLGEMEYWSGKQIKDDPTLTAIFQGTSSGLARAKLREWMELFTPIRVRFERDSNGKNTGKVIGVKLNTKQPDWKLPEARAYFFMEMDAKANKAKSAPKLERGIEAVIREAARMIDVVEGTTLDQIKAEIQKALIDNLAAAIIAERDKDKHEEWVETYQKEQADAARAKAA